VLSGVQKCAGWSPVSRSRGSLEAQKGWDQVMDSWAFSPQTDAEIGRPRPFFQKANRVSYRELAERLRTTGVDENARNISNKIARGGFTAAFFFHLDTDRR
jgi:Domain of unknown function (DUF6471)